MTDPKQQNPDSEHQHKNIEPNTEPRENKINSESQPSGTSRPSESSTKGKYTGCNCAKSQCLKMYCACFSVGKMCDEVLNA